MVQFHRLRRHLSHHNIYATNTTGHMVADCLSLNVCLPVLRPAGVDRSRAGSHTAI